LVDHLRRHATLQWFLILSCDCKNMKYGRSNLHFDMTRQAISKLWDQWKRIVADHSMWLTTVDCT
jgi:hypothetical protein